MNSSSMLKCLSECKSLAELEHETRVILESLQLSDFVFFRTNKEWKNHDSRGIINSLPVQWYRTYLHNKLYQSDLILSYATKNASPIFGHQLYDYIENAPFVMTLTEKNQKIINLYSTFNISNVYCIPQRAHNGCGKVVLLIVARNIEKSVFQSRVHRVTTLLNEVCTVLDCITTQKFGSFFLGELDQKPNITAKALKCLTALANADCTTIELAKQLHISPVTAHAQLAEARRALGVKTTIAAIAKASKLGLLNYI